jgi:hypothetical protein
MLTRHFELHGKPVFFRLAHDITLFSVIPQIGFVDKVFLVVGPAGIKKIAVPESDLL